MAKNFFASSKGAVLAGALIGLGAATLQKLGNPGNMGVCVACFGRDVAGSLGLHQAATVQYARPEFFALVLGAFAAAIAFGEFRPRTGSNPLVRFILGAMIGIGALIFLGCPWRALLRLAGGDWNAALGLAGLAVGVALATLLIRRNFTLGPNRPANGALGLAFVLLAAALLAVRIAYPPIPGEPKNDLLLYSVQGPGSLHAPLWASVAVALVIGVLGQRSRFCSIGAIQDLVLFRRARLLLGVVGFVAAAAAANLAYGQFHPGFAGQPVAHTLHFWNFWGLLIVGFGCALVGGCPGRQLFMAGEGDGDAAVFVLGMLAGLAMAHNWGLASSPAGLGPHGAAAGFVCALIVVVVGLAGLRKTPASAAA